MNVRIRTWIRLSGNRSHSVQSEVAANKWSDSTTPWTAFRTQPTTLSILVTMLTGFTIHNLKRFGEVEIELGSPVVFIWLT